jgi:hypothetical protein
MKKNVKHKENQEIPVYIDVEGAPKTKPHLPTRNGV